MSLRLDCMQPERLDRVLARHLAALHPELPVSRRWLKELFAKGQVRIGRRSVPAAHELKSGVHVISIAGWDPAGVRGRFVAQPAPSGCFVDVVFEDDDLLVLDKPAGVASAPLSGADCNTAVNAALAHFPALVRVGNSSLEPGLLHRLDTGTSGLLAFAKHRDAFLRLRSLWKQGRVAKYYHALVGSAPPKGLIDVPLARAAGRSGRMLAVEPGKQNWKMRGRPLPARTEILDVRRETRACHRVFIQLHTGVMHQIRCHLASVGAPILGDELYGGPPASRLALHAWKLLLPTPGGVPGAVIEVESRMLLAPDTA